MADTCKTKIPIGVDAFTRKNMVLCAACYHKLTHRKADTTKTHQLTPNIGVSIQGTKMWVDF